ncbi:MAG: secondary thiamine-phosphate synthase enzyme YjbQ [Pseudomonadota bacterium]|jgi:secondary thiamine-phosphate synthase enzyme
MWFQKTIVLKPRSRGFHLITAELTANLPELGQFRQGLAHFFIQHTSASLTINENADADVRRDLESYLLAQVPDGAPYYRHILEGDDDMPAHIKATLVGNSVTVPVRQGRLALGTWQGIYLGEHRTHGGARSLVATLHGD